MNKPGFRFKDGKPFLFDSKSVSVIESWPSLKALHKEGSHGWSEFRRIFPHLRPKGMDTEVDPALLPSDSLQIARQRRAAFLACGSYIPEPVAKACEEIPDKQLTIPTLLMASPAAVTFSLNTELAKKRPIASNTSSSTKCSTS